jgi:hypothetical protein
MRPSTERAGEEVSGPYQVVKGWPQPVIDGWTINAETMYAESPDRIIAVGRGTHKSPWTTFWGPAAFRNLGKPIPPAEQKQQRMIVVYNRQGKVVESWDQWSPLLVDVQLVQENPYDPEHHIWIATDESLVELTRDGKTHVKTIDVKDIPPAQTQNGNFVVEFFAFASNGDLWAAGGNRMVRFNKDGKVRLGIRQGRHRAGRVRHRRRGTARQRHSRRRHRLESKPHVHRRPRQFADQVFDSEWQVPDQWPNIVGAYGIRLTAGRPVRVGE